MIKTLLGSMTTRIFLILVGGTLISGALVMSLADYERHSLNEHLHTRHTVERVQQIIRLLDETPSSANYAIADIANQYGIRVDLSPSMTVIGKLPDSEMTAELRTALGSYRDISVLQSEGAGCGPMVMDHEPPMMGTPHCETILTTLKDGSHVRIDVAHRNRPPPPFQGNFIRDLALFLAGLAMIALIVAHMATKPLRRLATAALNLSRNIEHKPLPIDEGSTEVREAALAFNNMQRSIRNHIEERTCMLAAIAHDLQTPLTRLRLRLEKVTDSNLREQLVDDLTTTQAMIKEGLDFARTLSVEDPMERVDVDSLVESICNDAIDGGWEVTCSGHIGQSIFASPHALRRCISNLVDNAVQYGKFAHVSVSRENGNAVISIIDGGSGIPVDQLEKVFQPFNRIETSRSRHSGGTGLGLTIARIVAERHKGSIQLRNMDAPDLGLEARLLLPLS
jgi:signal transduction histidine kinase